MREWRKKFPSVLGLLAVTALLALPALAIAQQAGADGAAALDPGAATGGLPPGAHFAMHHIVKQLNLSAEQQASAKQLFQDFKTKMAPVHQAQQQLHTQLEAALAAPSPDPAAVGQIVIAMHQNRAQMKPAMDALQQQFQALLNPDQQAKYKQLLAAHPFFRHFRGDSTPSSTP